MAASGLGLIQTDEPVSIGHKFAEHGEAGEGGELVQWKFSLLGGESACEEVEPLGF
jgi:hypothetical protein